MEHNTNEINAVSGIKIGLAHMCSKSILGAFNSVISLAQISTVAHCHPEMAQGKSKSFHVFCVQGWGKKLNFRENKAKHYSFIFMQSCFVSVLHFRGLCKTSLKKLHDIKVRNLAAGKCKRWNCTDQQGYCTCTWEIFRIIMLINFPLLNRLCRP